MLQTNFLAVCDLARGIVLYDVRKPQRIRKVCFIKYVKTVVSSRAAPSLNSKNQDLNLNKILLVYFVTKNIK